MFGQPDFFVSQMPAPSWKPASMAFDYTTVPDPDVHDLQLLHRAENVGSDDGDKTQINLFFHLFFVPLQPFCEKGI